MQFLVETNDEGIKPLIEEAAEGKKSYYISGPFMQAECVNRNKRFYPRPVLESQMEHQKFLIEKKRALGELNHPNTPNVNLERASHLITQLEWRGNDVWGKAKVLENMDCGRVVANLIDEGIGFGVSTRGLGTVRPNSKGVNEVQKDFKLVCVDVVSDPSGPDCWVNGLMEGAEWAINPVSGLWEQVKDVVEQHVRSRTLTLEQKAKLFREATGILAKTKLS